MSHTAIAAALALADVSPGERLVALSLASYANRENRAWPGAPAAAARAGLSRSRYLHARDRLVRRGLLAIEDAASGRGRSTTVLLAFAESGARYDGPINPALFEAVLSRSDARGPARQLLAAAAALADDRGVLEGLTTAELREAAGLADSTYRRARTALLASGELVLEQVARGRGNTNRWEVRDPRAAEARTVPPRSRAKHPPNARPLLATIPPPSTDTQAPAKPAQDGTHSAKKGPVPGGISRPKPARSKTVSPKNPPENPPENPPPHARTGREPGNQEIPNHPPSPPSGGSGPDSVTIFEDTVSARGRKRRRPVTVSLAEVRAQLLAPTAVDRSTWSAARARMARAVSEDMFAIWLEPIELVATDRAGVLILGCSEATRGWVQSRYGRLLDAAGETAGRRLRLAEAHELQAVSSRLPDRESALFGHAHKHPGGSGSLPSPIHNQKEAS